MVSPLIAQLLWFLVVIMMVIEVNVVVGAVVQEVIRVVVEAVVDLVLVLTVVVENTLLKLHGKPFDAANQIFYQDDTSVVASIPRLLLPHIVLLLLKDLKTKRKIGTRHEAGGLYYFDFDSPTRAL
ncbi:unnamed protein product [Ilex paraguariensis]|uniref:Secreted protein n=1 Tax=Ilex paraguariensis TaxID=185542 RepID=A0ABC8REZ2_9AQUA